MQEFVGVNRANLATLSALFPKTKLRMHQNVIKVLGEPQAAEEMLQILSELEAVCSRHNQLTEAQLIEVVQRHRYPTPRGEPASDGTRVCLSGYVLRHRICG